MNETRSHIAEVAELTRTLRDVLGVLALPAVWKGRSVEDIVALLCQALDATLDVDVVYACASSGGSSPCEALWVRGSKCLARLEEFRAATESLRSARASSVGSGSCLDLGQLLFEVEPFGYRAAHGVLVVGAAREGFPTASDAVVARAAAALVTTTLEMTKALAERQEALRAKDEFLAMLGHELRNPLAPIAGALEVMARRRNDGEPSNEERIIARQVNHLGRLVDDLLDISRVTRGSLELKKKAVDLHDVVDRAVEMTAALLEARGHRLEVTAPPGTVVLGDPFRLAQVFANLLANAAKYTPTGGRVELSVARSEDGARISVRDDGIGIEPALLPRIFDLFVQGRPTGDPQYGGLGLGLALARTFVSLHDGKITARSEGRGRGTEVVVELPLLTSSGDVAKPEQPAARAATTAAPRRVFVVDDNVDACEMIGELVRMHGHDVRLAHDPNDALRLVTADPPDIVILDIGLPEMNGYELASAIRQSLGDRTPVLVALTGYGAAKDHDESRKAGFAAHFVKPVDTEKLLATIAAIDVRRDR